MRKVILRRRPASKFPRNFPCPICGELVPLEISKKKKPYFKCLYCGLQVFFRGKFGISELLKINSHISRRKNSSAISVLCDLFIFRIKNYLFKLQKIEEKEDSGEIKFEEMLQKPALKEKIRLFLPEYKKLIQELHKMGISLPNENGEG